MSNNNNSSSHEQEQQLLNYHDAVIYPSDLALLDSPTAWLNDACINFQMAYLQQNQKDDAADKKPGDEREQKRQKNWTAEGMDQLDDLFLDP